ncbi:molybdenum cofactor biosynthesis protein MogA, partial [gut metagenome]
MKPPRQHPQELILGLVSVLDTNSPSTYDDKTVSSLETWFRDNLTTPVKTHKRVVPNERFVIEKTLRELVDIIGCDLIITTGSIGPTRHDHMPESTTAIATRCLPGLADLLRQH